MSQLDYVRPNVFVDMVVFTLFENSQSLHVLLVKRKAEPFLGTLALPGGIVHANEDKSLEDTCQRIFKEKLNSNAFHLEQLKTFGSSDRDARGWSVSIAYLAVVSQESLPVIEDGVFVDVASLSASDIPFDHYQIIQEALARVKDKSSYSSLPLFFLNKTFTLPELQNAYEVVLGMPLNISAFRRKILGQDLIEEVGFINDKNSRGRPASFYRAKNSSLHDMGRVVMLPDSRRGG